MSCLQKGHVDASVRDLSDNLAEDLALRPKLRNKVLVYSATNGRKGGLLRSRFTIRVR